jgi:hypothetical protein
VLQLEPTKGNEGKIGQMSKDGKVIYPIEVSHDMGWQKGKKTYDSISGHGLMIGNTTKNVVAFQNFLSSCGACQHHNKKMDGLKTPDVPVLEPQCPKIYTGSLKGMEVKASLDCVNKVWSHAWIEAFISITCINDDATMTRAYFQHSFANLDWKNLPRSTNKEGEPKTGKRNNKGQLGKDHPVIKFLADLSLQVRTFAKYQKWLF